MKPFGTRLLKITTLSAFVLGAMTAGADTYPSRPVRLLVAQGAGTTADLLARAVGMELSKELGQPFVVENKAGAGGSIAMAETARALPDGYTIAIASQGNLVFNLSLYAKPGYDSVKDFAPIGLIGGVSNMMIVPPNSGMGSVMEVVAKAKAQPGGLTYSSGGSGTSHHLSGVLFSQLMGIELVHVPYKAAPQGILAVMGAEVDMGFYNTPTVLAQIKSGKVKPLAVTSKSRSALLPDLPTMDASGARGYEVNTWLGLIAPAATAPAIVSRLNKALTVVLARPELKAGLAAQGVDIAADQTPAGMAQVLKDDLKAWPAIINASGAKID